MRSLYFSEQITDYIDQRITKELNKVQNIISSEVCVTKQYTDLGYVGLTEFGCD